MISLALKNISRRPGSTLFTVLVLAVTSAAVSAAWFLAAAVRGGMEMSAQRLGADVLICPSEFETGERGLLFTGIGEMAFMDESSVLEAVPADMAESVTRQFYIRTLATGGCCEFTESIRIVGVDFDSDFILKPWIGSGGIVPAMTSGRALIAGSVLAEELADRTFVFNNIMDVAASLQPTSTFMDESLFIDINTARKLSVRFFDPRVFGMRDPRKLITCVLVKLKDGVAPEAFIEEYRRRGGTERAVSIPAAQGAMRAQIDRLLRVISIFACAALLLGVTALFAHFSSAVSARKADVGWLRAIGVKKSGIFLMFSAEALIPSLIGGAIGGTVGAVISDFAAETMRSVLVIPRGAGSDIAVRIGISVAVSALISIISVLPAAARMSSLSPRDAMEVL